MVSESLIINMVTVVVVGVLVATGLMPKKIKYAVNALIIFALGILPLLYRLDVIGFTFGEAGIIKYVVAVVVVYTAQNLISEGIKEEHAIKWITITVGVLVIIMALVPTLHQMGALTFTLPEYPEIINYVMYTVAGLLLFVGVFLSRSN